MPIKEYGLKRLRRKAMAGKRLFALACGLLAVLVTGGCGYHFAGEGPGPKPGLQRIAIPVFENTSSEAELETIFAGALRHEFILRSPYQLVTVEQAEAVFRGRITKLFTTELAHIGPEETIETRIYVTVDIRCQDTKTGASLWQDNSLTYYGKYLQDPDPIISYQNRRRALAIIARDIAVRIHDRFLSNF
jgi:hypothetical protein